MRALVLGKLSLTVGKGPTHTRRMHALHGQCRPLCDLGVEDARAIKYVLMDIDDTITKDGRLLRESFDALWRLKDLGFRVLPITGRPAGWCDLIARQWPVDGVVGENGAFAFYMDGPSLKQLRNPAAVVPTDGGNLLRATERCLREVPLTRMAKDQFSRIYDRAIDFAEEPPVLGLDAARRIRDIAEEEGCKAKISSIHVNIWVGDYDKLGMTELFLSRMYGWDPQAGLREVLFVGDSPNDEPMFARFPLSCAVANFRRYADLVENKPAFITNAEYGYGFSEAVAHIVNLRAV